MTQSSSILVFGRDLALLDTRALVLKQAGYKVKAFSSWEEAPETEAVDLMILCHSLTEAERTTILRSAAAQWPSARKLAMAPLRGSVEGMAEVFNSFEGPAKLVERVRNLLSGRQLNQA